MATIRYSIWALVYLFTLSNIFASPTQSNIIDKVKVKNQTGMEIHYLYISPSEDGWGDDLLGDETLADGATFTASLKQYGSKCEFDIKAVSEEEDEYFLWEQNLCSNSNVTINEDNLEESEDAAEEEETEAPSGDQVSISNAVGETIFYLFSRRAGTNDWGSDLLPSNKVLSNQGNVNVSIPGFSSNNCRFDIRGTDLEKKKEFIVRDVNLCASKRITISSNNGNSTSSSDNDDNAITVENAVGETVFYIFARKAGTTDWGNDRLASNKTLATNSDITVVISELSRNNCRFDIRGTDLNKTKEFVVRDVNLCSTKTVRLTANSQATSSSTTTSTTSPATSDEEDAIGVENQTGETIFYLFVRKTGTSDWGNDRLDSSNTLQNATDQTVIISEVGGSNCRFDVKGTNLEKTVNYTLRNVDLCSRKTITLNRSHKN